MIIISLWWGILQNGLTKHKTLILKTPNHGGFWASATPITTEVPRVFLYAPEYWPRAGTDAAETFDPTELTGAFHVGNEGMLHSSY